MVLKFRKVFRFITTVTTVLIILFSTLDVKAQETEVKKDTLTKTVLIHPVIETGKDEVLLTFGHEYKDHLQLGDQLAHDYVVVENNGEGEAVEYKNDGEENKDYTSWRKNVMAPVSGVVVLVNHPTKTNKPKVMSRDVEPGRIYIKNNGMTVSLVHVREIDVEKGQEVKAGEVVAKVGNNGNSTGPHVHVGAWKNGSPYQPVIDLYAEQRYSY